MLVVDGLCIDVHGVRLVDCATFRVESGERVGLLGPSGSGKSMIASAIVGHTAPAVRVSGRIAIGGRDVAGVPAPQRPPQARAAMVFQDSATALNPMVTVGAQLREPCSRHAGADPAKLLAQVGFDDPPRILAAHPLELSGGQRQRICIALAMACHSSLLVADEPTTALDLLTQAAVVDAIRATTGTPTTALLFITHDVALAANLCDRLIVLDAGRVIEQGSATELLAAPTMPSTKALIARAHASDPALVLGLARR